MIDLIILFVSYLARLLVLVVFVSALLSFFLDPYHPLRRWLGSVVDPMLAPIRRLMPPMGGWDLSPLILIVLIQVLANIIIRLLATLR